MKKGNFVFPKECKAIIDVTKPPYNVDNTGKTDCTKTLCKIVDDVLSAYENNFHETKEKLEAIDDDNALISFEIRKINGRSNVIFPEYIPDSKIIYFPDGTYLVSDTISYFKEEFRNILGGIRHLEMNCQLRFMGQSRDGVIIKLQDNCKGFEYGNDRPVISFMQGEASNIAMTNMFENITINIGKGNPGATGIRYFANNTGALRNIRIISSDPEYRGNTGLSVLHDKISAGYTKNIEIIGFDYGMKLMSDTGYMPLEHISIKHQRKLGILVGNLVTSFRDIKSDNFVPVLKIGGTSGFSSVIDGNFTGGNPLDAAIKSHSGYCFARNIYSEGYEYIIKDFFKQKELCGDYLEEYSSHGPKMLFEGNNKSLNLPILETPDVEWDNPDEWICVNDFGAIGDGITDDTKAIQKAFKSGKSTFYFQPGRYLINDVIEIPETVNRINFMYGDLLSGKKLQSMKNTGAFKIVGSNDSPVIIEDLFAWEKFFGYMSLIDHAGKRTLIISDVHVQAASIYFNSISGGKVFMENVGCTIGGVPGAGARNEKLPNEDKFMYSREVPCFSFKNQEVYCRQLNPERSLHEVVNDGGTLWVFGGKTEEEGTAYETINSGNTEVIGVTFTIGLNKQHPLIINKDSNVSVYGSTFGMHFKQLWPITVRETHKGITKEFKDIDMPVRYMISYAIPLYVGREEDDSMGD